MTILFVTIYFVMYMYVLVLYIAGCLSVHKRNRLEVDRLSSSCIYEGWEGVLMGFIVANALSN